MATQVPAVQASGVRLNYPAIITAAIAGFLLEAGWYSAFYRLWLEGIGRTDEWLRQNSPNRALQFAIALVCTAVVAGAVSCVIQTTGRQTLLRGIWVGALLGLGLVLPIFGLEYIFEVRTIELLLINAGFWIVGMMLMGAIVGAWKAKAAR
jgi:hypothetical protein